MAGQRAGAGQAAHRLERGHDQEGAATAAAGCAPAGDSTASTAAWPHSRAPAPASAVPRATSRCAPSSAPSRAWTGRQHAALGAERPHLAQAGQRIERGDAQRAGAGGEPHAGRCRAARRKPRQRESGEGEQQAEQNRQANRRRAAAAPDQHRPGPGSSSAAPASGTRMRR